MPFSIHEWCRRLISKPRRSRPKVSPRTLAWFRPRLEVLEDRLCPAAQTFMVTSNTDDGTGQPGTLSAAIMGADNPNNAGSTIDFSIGGVQGEKATIRVTGVLPSVTEPTVINGWSQSHNLSALVPYVGLDGTGVMGTGLESSAGNVTIEGLAIWGFSDNGILLNQRSPLQGDTVQGSYVGTDLSGSAAGLGSATGIRVESGYNTIGGTVQGAGNVVSGNGVGILIDLGASTNNLVEGNSVGVNATGTTALANGEGINVSTSNNTIGGSPNGNSMGTTTGNVISGNTSNGIHLNDASYNAIWGNSIGVAADGKTQIANGGNGILLEGTANWNTIGGLVGQGNQAGNVVSGNGTNGIDLNDSSSNEVFNNSIGVASDGATKVTNGGNGVQVEGGADSNSIGMSGGHGNLISGNTGNGIYLTGANTSATVIAANSIGVASDGLTRVANGGDGITLDNGTSANSIGGSLPGGGNVISGNNHYGINLGGGGQDWVADNSIGVDKSGTKAVVNWGKAPLPGGVGVGIWVASNNNTIGANGASMGLNIISGNSDGMYIVGSSNLVNGNYIGTDISGKAAIGNSGSGIYLRYANNNTIGSLQALPFGVTTSNVISGNGTGELTNDSAGITIWGGTGTVIAQDFIGTDVTGAAPLGNWGDGIQFQVTVTNTTIGAAPGLLPTVISANGLAPKDQASVGYGIDTSGNAVFVQNSYIGLNVNGADPLKNMANLLGWVDNPNNVTKGGNVNTQ
jgi:hypothetical protein